MKRTLSVIMAIIMLTALCACGQSNSTEEPVIPAHESAPFVASTPEADKQGENQPVEDPNGGIVMISVLEGAKYSYKSTGTYKCTANTVNIDFIDPDTGTVKHWKTFSSAETHSCTPYFYCGNSTAAMKRYFNEDMTRMTATLTKEDGSVHIGWIDEDGRFTDVSEKITVKSDFSGLTNHAEPCFWGDYIYFTDRGEESKKRVPINNLTPDAVETMASAKWAGIFIRPDGSVEDTPYTVCEFSDESMSHAMTNTVFGDWVSQSECVGTQDGTIYKYGLNKTDGHGFGFISDYYYERTPLVPSVKNRTNRNPVLSPDGASVAFLSRMDAGTDQSEHLYIVPLNGGDPIKVNTSYVFNGMYKASILDWWESVSLKPKSDDPADEAPLVNDQPAVESKGLLGYITDSASGFDDDTVAGICRLMGVNYYEYDDCEVFVLFDDSDEALIAAARNLIGMGAETLVFNVGDLTKYEPVRKQLAEEFPDVKLLPIVD